MSNFSFLTLILDKVAGRHHPRDQSICTRDIHLLVGSSQGKLKRDITVSHFINKLTNIKYIYQACMEEIFGEEDARQFLIDGLYTAEQDSRGYFNFQPNGPHGSRSPPLRFPTKIIRVSIMTYAQILHLLVSNNYNRKNYPNILKNISFSVRCHSSLDHPIPASTTRITTNQTWTIEWICVRRTIHLLLHHLPSRGLLLHWCDHHPRGIVITQTFRTRSQSLKILERDEFCLFDLRPSSRA